MTSENVLDYSTTDAPTLGKRLKPWLRRILGVVITLAIFVWMFKPVYKQWDLVKEPILKTDWRLFFLASAMFAAFLFIFRVLSWRWIVEGLGHKLPLAPATRIWSTSELARYLPGAIWQVVGRVYLVRPYGVSGPVCSTSQLLELTVFLLANVLVAVSCLVFQGTKLPDSTASKSLYFFALLIPTLLILIHPTVFYGLLNKLMGRLNKPQIVQRLSGQNLIKLTLWAILGLLWQALAIWLIVHGPLHLGIRKWWIVAGAYGLAWCSGFIAFWAPGGLGVREAVFMMVMSHILPKKLRVDIFHSPEALAAFLAFLGVLLRLWATTGELMLTSLAYSFDFKGAMGKTKPPVDEIPIDRSPTAPEHVAQ